MTPPGQIHIVILSIVLGVRHPAVLTRDVALYQPFRNALKTPKQVVGLRTLMWHLMRRRCQDGKQCAVSLGLGASNPTRGGRTVATSSGYQINCLLTPIVHQLENARAAMDLYRSHATEWEDVISKGQWPSHLPPDTFARCYL